jgi:uncharacterized protein
VPVLTWAGTDEWRAESADVQVQEDRFTATGVQLGVEPLPYRLDYALETAAGWVTRTLRVTAAGDGWRRLLHLARDPAGRWSVEADSAGGADLPAAGGDAAAVAGAEDCDLGLSPLSNTMPILRHRLHREPGAVELTMAWVSVPDLGLHRSVQRYEHLRTTPRGAVVRFVSGDFTADLVVDRAGFVLDYPDLARRCGADDPWRDG